MNSLLRNRHFIAGTEVLVWYVLLFSLAIQRRVIVYQATWDFREWLSFSLYGTDLLFLALLVVSTFLHPQWFRGTVRRFEYVLGGFLVLSTISVSYASYQGVAAFSVLRLAEFAVLYWYVSRYALVHFNKLYSSLALLGGILVQAIIGIGQFFVQHDLGLRMVGESVLDPYMHGVASFFLASGEKIMRAYGSMPHPNVLAAYVLVGLVLTCVLFIQQPVTRKTVGVFVTIYGVLLWAFALTFSRTVVALWIILMVVGGWVLWRRREVSRHALLAIVYATVIIGGLLVVSYWPEAVNRITITSEEEAVQLRLYYTGQALSSGASGQLNWFGVGAGNFVGWLMVYQPHIARYLYQPVHNIYLLVYSELGIIGLLLLLGLLVGLAIMFFRNKQGWEGQILFLTWIALLAAGLLDHFPWTLQQGRFLLWGATAVVAFCALEKDTLL